MADVSSLGPITIKLMTDAGYDRDFSVADMVAFEYVKTPTALADYFIDCFAAEDERISAFGNRLRLALSDKISGMESTLALLEQRIKEGDPRNILSRGYSLVTDDGGVVVNSAAGLRSGQRLRILFAVGAVGAQIVDTQ